MAERTLILVKPDAMQRGLAGEVLSRFERRGLKLVALRMMQMDRTLAAKHYAEHIGKAFYKPLVSFITSGPIIAALFEAENAVELARQTIGATDPAKSAPGSIRGDLGIDLGRNVVHGSDSAESAVREAALFFDEKDVVEWQRSVEGWIVER
ncbi:MAG: nucleoside-diphosphate kinase [Dehalococcoidia bacterium]|jgi:nucleoside-diphosphate kinase